jgi:hypothetical protein
MEILSWGVFEKMAGLKKGMGSFGVEGTLSEDCFEQNENAFSFV